MAGSPAMLLDQVLVVAVVIEVFVGCDIEEEADYCEGAEVPGMSAISAFVVMAFQGSYSSYPSATALAMNHHNLASPSAGARNAVLLGVFRVLHDEAFLVKVVMGLWMESVAYLGQAASVVRFGVGDSHFGDAIP